MIHKFLFTTYLLLSFTIFPKLIISQTDVSERIYLHTDKPLYFPGETIWFKAYVVGVDNTITKISDYINVDLLSPKGDVVKKLKLPLKQGYTYGDFMLAKDVSGGMFQIKAYSKWMKNLSEADTFNRKIIVQKIVKPKLLMKLKFEKEAYGKNSDVKAIFELKDLTNNALINYKIEYVLNIKGQKALTGKLFTDAKGKIDVEFKLPADLNTSDLILNILVPYKGNIESISRSVPVILDNIDLQFMPEGGYLLTDVNCNVAFKALNEFGKPADIAAEIFNENGEIICKTESFHDGMGVFKLQQEKNKSYYAKIVKPFVSEKKYFLPKAKHTGFTMLLDKNDSTLIKFKIFAKKQTTASVVAKTAKKVILTKSIVLKNGWNEISFQANKFPLGIVEFTLLNNEGNPELERLVFANKTRDLRIKVKTNKELYSPREKVEVELLTTNHLGQPIPSNLSVAVVDDKIISFADDKQDNILSYLLMSSYLKGTIEKPNFYFDPEEEKAEKALDLVLMTHGWRLYFTDKKMENLEKISEAEKFHLELRTVVNDKDEPVKATVLVIEQNANNNAIKIETDESGVFSFNTEANKEYLIAAYNKNNEQLYIKTGNITSKKEEKTINSTKNKQKTGKIEEKDLPFIEQKGVQNKNKETRTAESGKKNSSIVSTNLDQESTGLDEVVVVGYGTSKKSDLTGSICSVEIEDLTVAENITNALQGRIAGVVIKNTSPGSSGNIRIRGTSSLSANSEPLYILNGIPINDIESKDILSTLNPEEIESITVLKNASASALYGSRGANGVIVIETENSQWWQCKSIRFNKAKKIAFETVYGERIMLLSYSRTFYMPLYDSKEAIKTRTDFRQTIYWNPVVQTDENGKASFSFYNSDAITSYRIFSEGVGYNGLPGRDETTYSIQKPLSIDVKLPAYLSIGDTVNVPVTITNNTNFELKTASKIRFSKAFKVLDAVNDSSSIAGLKGKTRIVRVVPINKANKSSASFEVVSNAFNDKFIQEIEITNPLFPKAFAISGNQSNQFEFEINDTIVPNTLKAGITFYLDIIGDVMNGIESILGEPHGCFEQVSSTAYPNVLVLKYLKENGKLSTDIKKKAMKYIKSGYRQLAAYETKQGGFEWYGGTPPHEVLSAYGIMEFMEMKEVYSGVDEKMINRTVEWLMTRKNRKGGFKQNRGKYGFSAAPENVNNAYIVYALSQKGVNAPIEKEYQTAFSEAVQSKDCYRLALLASASYNLNRPENYRKAIELLIENINWENLMQLKVENSITRSYGTSLQVETMAFIALALMQGNENFKYVKKCIDFILANRKYGRFGNTQATSMALKALIEYTKHQHNEILLSKEQPVIVKINGNKIKLSKIENGLINLNGLEEHFLQGQQLVEVQFPNDNMTVPYEMNIYWKTNIPGSADQCPLTLSTEMLQKQIKLGETARMKIEVKNQRQVGVPMTTAVVGIPSGLSVQIWQLEEMKEKGEFDYYEINKNKVVFYWRELGPQESKNISIDLKTEVKGCYTAVASSVYLYYADENKKWVKGEIVEIN